jgi:hypothetical protein
VFPAKTSVIAPTRLSLQASISSADSYFVAFTCNGRGVSGSPLREDSDTRSSISSSMVVERISSSQGDESAAYVLLDDRCNYRYSFSDLDTFWTVPKRWILRHVQCFRVGHWIQHKDCTVAPAFDGSH